ncbi:MAG TPA: hypothetical protein DCS43_07500 [Verrucomicrobia bacterium]|nr:hypothetical protein [Verrucomicrobiota bacterium]
MAIGPILQQARLKKQMTTSQVAEVTRMKMQMVEGLERDDFSHVAATIYGKGFIKLYAQCVGLDPEPLIEDYMRTVRGDHAPNVRQALVASPAAVGGGPIRSNTSVGEDVPPVEDLFTFADAKRTRITHSPGGPLRPSLAENSSPTAPTPIRHRAHSETSPFALRMKTLAQRGIRQAVLLAKRLKEWLSGLKWSDQFLKRLGVGLLVIVLVGILALVIRHLVARSGPRPLEDQELLLFTPPPEPYVD